MQRILDVGAIVACMLTLVGVRLAAQGGTHAVFERGLTALHYFEYEEANEAFREARLADPGFVMAYWGEAMTYHQTLWRNEDVHAGRLSLARLGSTLAARRAKTRTPTEQGFLAAVEILFGEGDAATRRRNYADAMARLYAFQPDDPDVASFYALALLGTMSRSLIGYLDAHEGHSQTLAGSDTQAQVATILGKVLQSHPKHPGALHYLLHNHDDPKHAHLALGAARTLAKLGPASSHALHMPSHIFFQLGMWHDAAISDRAAFAASDTQVRQKSQNAAMRNYHALSWLQYELLQLGRYGEARAAIADVEPVVKATGQLTLLSDLSTMRARYVVETSSWNLMAAEDNFGNVNELFAIGMSAARAGNAERAEKVRHTLAERATDPREGDLRPAIAIMEREVAAVIALAAGRRDEAVGILQTAARAEILLPPPLGLPEPIKPAPELLGEILLDIGRPQDAIEPFEQALRRNVNRSLSVLGLARAATALGRTDTARERYGELLANLDGADAGLSLAQEARAAISRASGPASRRPSAAILVAMALAATITAALFIRRRAARPHANGSAGSRLPRSERRRRDRARR